MTKWLFDFSRVLSDEKKESKEKKKGFLMGFDWVGAFV